jgi:[acyl-carrier-protein] S-malonyltransferase
VDITDDEVHEYLQRNPRRFASTAQIAEHLCGAARRRAFRLWLDVRRAELVELAPGYEHPGDPRQPDNTHRH